MSKKEFQLPKRVLIVKRGLGRVQLGPRGETAEGVPTKPVYLSFTPWDVEHIGDISRKWGSFLASEETYEELFGDRELYDAVNTYEKFLEHFMRRGDYYFACPLTGRKFSNLEKYSEHMSELQESVAHMFD